MNRQRKCGPAWLTALPALTVLAFWPAGARAAQVDYFSKIPPGQTAPSTPLTPKAPSVKQLPSRKTNITPTLPKQKPPMTPSRKKSFTYTAPAPQAGPSRSEPLTLTVPAREKGYTDTAPSRKAMVTNTGVGAVPPAAKPKPGSEGMMKFMPTPGEGLMKKTAPGPSKGMSKIGTPPAPESAKGEVYPKVEIHTGAARGGSGVPAEAQQTAPQEASGLGSETEIAEQKVKGISPSGPADAPPPVR